MMLAMLDVGGFCPGSGNRQGERNQRTHTTTTQVEVVGEGEEI